MLKRFKNVFRSEAGFTLIELLVVIAVLGILAGIAVPRLTGVKEKARSTEAIAALGSLKTAFEMYYVEEDTYDLTNDSSFTSSGSASDNDLLQYVDPSSLPSDWTFEVTEASDDSYTIYAYETSIASETNGISAKLEKGSDVTAKTDVTESDKNSW